MIWPFPALRNYRTNSDLTDLFLAFANAHDVVIEIKDKPLRNVGPYYATATCDLGILRFWIANAYYAWASEGTFTNRRGEATNWKDEMPSRWAVKRMAKLVDEAEEGEKTFKWVNRVPVPAQIAKAVRGSR